MIKQALLYETLGNGFVRCRLCAHRCRIAEGAFGFCGVRQNKSGILYAYAYGSLIASHVDPIEKKPLYHFLPGSESFSVATIGCNMRCQHCQNWQISQKDFKDADELEQEEFSPEEIVDEALNNDCQSISYTYSEPTVFFEYALDTARIAKEKGLRNIFVTNGYMSEEALLMIRPYLDAANVDLKFYSEESYNKSCAARLAPVLDTIKRLKDLGIWVEVTTLVIPQKNDSRKELEDIAGFIAGVDKSIPWHVSRFHPDYKLTHHHVTPEATLEMARSVGFNAGLKFVYAGNISGWGNDTLCPKCEELLVKRENLKVYALNIEDGRCQFCKAPIAGVWS